VLDLFAAWRLGSVSGVWFGVGTTARFSDLRMKFVGNGQFVGDMGRVEAFLHFKGILASVLPVGTG